MEMAGGVSRVKRKPRPRVALILRRLDIPLAFVPPKRATGKVYFLAGKSVHPEVHHMKHFKMMGSFATLGEAQIASLHRPHRG